MIIQFNVIAQIVCYDDRLNETSSAVLAVVCISGFCKGKVENVLEFQALVTPKRGRIYFNVQAVVPWDSLI